MTGKHTINPAGSPLVGPMTGPVPSNQRESADKPEEFQRFEELAGKLARVPKSELDEKRKTA